MDNYTVNNFRLSALEDLRILCLQISEVSLDGNSTVLLLVLDRPALALYLRLLQCISHYMDLD